MGWIIFTIIAFIVGVPIVLGIGALVRAIGKEDQTAAEGAGSAIMWLGTPAVIVIWLIVTLASMFHQVPNGHVGAIYTFKAVTGTTGSGLVVTAPWQSVQSMDVREQSFGWVAPGSREDADFTGVQFRAGRMETFSDDNQDVFMDVTINIKVDREAVENILDNVGPDYFGKLFVTELPNILKEETTDYDSTVIAQNREKLRESVRTRMQKVLDDAGYAITVRKIGIYNMSFDPEYAQAIRDKVIAEQNAITERNKVEVAKAQADQVKETAKGEAEKLREEARGQADANRSINESLTPLLIQFQALQKLADNVQIALIPSGQGVIIDPATLLGLQPTPAPAP